ncbi:TonB-dependent hemoglobin/transferrin/lactoferrin family receptor [Novosphingobium sp. P6W]|uniref:TonB-dependent hemoglobin/transferrin/lactoferrin family receptor n=1 Tax=Novosphingobium sp. P6W TaxID=1609758 RepID=UPI0005C649F8|nr:TonB-dependent hemoglobin/transferrin/lactoferrin family receptor [Novosphingobium sp. P6W]AXB79283.1 TonB-dependent hemoglobin/transferrin/lactoferrin family receptor [Novosphingobium sp. P6W]
MNYSTRRSLALVLKLGTAMGMTAIAFAPAQAQTTTDGESQPAEFGSVRVEAAAIDTPADRAAPGKPAVLTTTTSATTLRERMVDSIADYARRVDAGVNFNSNNFSINIRGLDANRVLTTVDGIRLPWLSDGARGVQGGVAAFDFNSLSSIDVVKSGDSSFFGQGALSGVFAVRTLDPEDLLAGGKKTGALAKATYDSASDSMFLNQAGAFRTGNTLVLIQGGYQNGEETESKGKTGGTGVRRTAQNPASYDQTNLLVKVHQYLGGGHRLGLSGELFKRSYDENTLTSVTSTYSDYATLEQNKRKRVAATYDYQSQGDDVIREAHLVGYWQRLNLRTRTQATRLTSPIGEYDRDSDLQDESYGLNGSIVAAASTGAVDHAISLGGEVYRTKTSQYAAGVDNCTAAIFSCSFLHVNQSDMPDVKSTDLGLYIQDRMTFGALHLTPGLRYDWYRRTPQETATYTLNAAYEGLPARSSDSKLSPKVLAEFDLTPGFTLYGQWSRAFRAPSATELYLTYGGTGSYVSIGNPDLKPETSNGYEVGAKFGDAARGFKVSVYDNYYRNFIDTVTTTAAAAGLSGSYPFGVFKYVNRAHVRIYGAEASAQWAFDDNWRVWGSIAYAHGRDTDEDTYLNSIPPLRGIAGVGYQQERFGADLSATVAAARNKVENPASTLNKTGSYGIVDFTAWVKPGLFDGLRLQGGVYNLLDKTYYNALDIPDSSTVPQLYYSQPGRTWKASMILSF